MKIKKMFLKSSVPVLFLVREGTELFCLLNVLSSCVDMFWSRLMEYIKNLAIIQIEECYYGLVWIDLCKTYEHSL